MQSEKAVKSGIIVTEAASMKLKVLTIDDDSSMTDLLSLLLCSYGLDVISANNGEKGLQLVCNEKPDLIMLDLTMPGVDGWQVCKAIRSFSKVPIIILSALDDPAIISSALDAGADDYLVKPIPSSVLIAHINNLTRRAHVENNKSTMLRQTGSLKKDADLLNVEQGSFQA
jgi:DNA-binding response OmpR family regulator